MLDRALLLTIRALTDAFIAWNCRRMWPIRLAWVLCDVRYAVLAAAKEGEGATGDSDAS